LGGEPHELVHIEWLQVEGCDAKAEVMELPKRPRGRAFAMLERLSTKTRSQFRLKHTYVGNIMECKLAVPEGGLRLLFVYGKSHVWCIGAFIKKNEKDGNRKLQSYLKRSILAESL